MKKNLLKLTLLTAIIAFSFQLTAQTTTVVYSGSLTNYTVPAGVVSIRIEALGSAGAVGSSGGAGGLGARMIGDFTVIPGSVLSVYAGGNPGAQAGGQGSYVSNGSTPLIIAGGGGGGANTAAGRSAGITTSGLGPTITTYGAGVGGSSGSGGTAGPGTWGTGGGGGWLSAGGNASGSIGGAILCKASLGTTFAGGAGGGYSGGGGTAMASGWGIAGGGSGGSYNIGTNQSNTAGFQTGTGSIIITVLSGLNITQTSSITCNGQLTAALSASVIGVAGPYTYSWAPIGGTSSTATGLGAGTYTCTATTSNGPVSNTFVVTQPAVLAATPTQTNLTCFGSGNGRASVAVTGGTAPYTYSWSPSGGTTATAINLAANNYTCTVTDANACPVLSTTFNITQPVSLISATSTQTNVSCFGGSNGVGAITASGGTGALTYSWAPSGGTSATASGLASNNYSCTIKDVNNCSITNTLTITQPTLLTSTLVSQTNVSCNAGSNGAASVTAAGGTTAYTYAWTPTGGSSASATGLAAGTYTCTITDAKSCVSTKTVAITQPAAALAAATTQTNILCFGLNTGAANVATTGGTTAYTYVWAPTGGTSATATSLVAGNYTCTITDANACTLVKTFALTQGSAFTISGSATNTVLCSGVSTILNGAGASTYTWTGGVTNGTSFVPTTTTSYSLTGKNASNCPASNTVVVTVTVNPLPSVAVNSGSICNGSSFIMNPTGASTYVYTGGSATVSPTTNTNYTVTGTSTLGCTSTAVSSVTVYANPVLTVNSGSICSGNNFTFTPTGSTTYSYSSGSAIVSPSVTTDYTISTTNAFGCTTNSVKTITVSITPVINVSSGAVCTGGTWTITPTGAATYTYSSGSAIVTPTAATTDYTVSGSNIDGCQSLAVITITVNPTLLFNPNSGSVCIGSSYTITPTGAVSYTFSSGSAIVTPTTNTTYTIVAENSVGCLGTDICTIVVNPLPTVTAATDFTLICLGEVATLTAGGATTYVWNTGATTATTATTPTTTTIYNVNGTDVNGCVNTANVTVNVNDCVGIQQLSSAKLNVSVYPNPTTGLVTLDLNAATQITITNALGQVILTETVVAGKQTINLKNQNNGLYFMNLQQDGKQQTIKVIKN